MIGVFACVTVFPRRRSNFCTCVRRSLSDRTGGRGRGQALLRRLTQVLFLLWSFEESLRRFAAAVLAFSLLRGSPTQLLPEDFLLGSQRFGATLKGRARINNARMQCTRGSRMLTSCKHSALQSAHHKCNTMQCNQLLCKQRISLP